MSNSFWPDELQQAGLSCPSLSPRVCSNSGPSSRWCLPTISSSFAPFSSCLQPSIRVFSNESALRFRWPKYWSFSFSISPSNEYSGFISFKIDWFDLLAVQGTLKNLLQHHSSKASILELSCRICLYIFVISSLSVASFASIFSHSEGCLFTFLIVSYPKQFIDSMQSLSSYQRYSSQS